jgi:hypothetical protein
MAEHVNNPSLGLATAEGLTLSIESVVVRLWFKVPGCLTLEWSKVFAVDPRNLNGRRCHFYLTFLSMKSHS